MENAKRRGRIWYGLAIDEHFVEALCHFMGLRKITKNSHFFNLMNERTVLWLEIDSSWKIKQKNRFTSKYLGQIGWFNKTSKNCYFLWIGGGIEGHKSIWNHILSTQFVSSYRFKVLLLHNICLRIWQRRHLFENPPKFGNRFYF